MLVQGYTFAVLQEEGHPPAVLPDVLPSPPCLVHRPIPCPHLCRDSPECSGINRAGQGPRWQLPCFTFSPQRTFILVWTWKTLKHVFFRVYLAFRTLTEHTSVNHVGKCAFFRLISTECQECPGCLVRCEISQIKYWEAVVWDSVSGARLPVFQLSSAPF